MHFHQLDKGLHGAGEILSLSVNDTETGGKSSFVKAKEGAPFLDQEMPDLFRILRKAVEFHIPDSAFQGIQMDEAYLRVCPFQL